MRRVIPLVLLAVLTAAPSLRAQPAAPAPSAEQQRLGDARIQKALRRVLGVLMQQYAELAGKVPEGLNDADIAMREGLQALAAGNDVAAAASIQRAVEALQKGGRAMGQQLVQQFGTPQDQGDGEDDEDGDQAASQAEGSGSQHGRNGRWDPNRRADDRRDPLGRRLREDGSGRSQDESGVRVPDEMEQARSHAIQEELRRREAEKARPQPELDYIERLLRQF